jgi:hypothetical protein
MLCVATSFGRARQRRKIRVTSATVLENPGSAAVLLDHAAAVTICGVGVSSSDSSMLLSRTTTAQRAANSIQLLIILASHPRVD